MPLNKFLLSLFLLFSTLFAEIDPEILKLNQQIYNYRNMVSAFNITEDYSLVDEIISNCNKIQYLHGAAQAIEIKYEQTIYLKDYKTQVSMIEEYEKYLYDVRKIGGMTYDEMYTEILLIIQKIELEGYEEYRLDLDRVEKQSKKLNYIDINILSNMIAYLNLYDYEDQVYEQKLVTSFKDFPEHKLSLYYLRYISYLGSNALKNKSDYSEVLELLEEQLKYLKELGIYESYQYWTLITEMEKLICQYQLEDLSSDKLKEIEKYISKLLKLEMPLNMIAEDLTYYSSYIYNNNNNEQLIKWNNLLLDIEKILVQYKTTNKIYLENEFAHYKLISDDEILPETITDHINEEYFWNLYILLAKNYNANGDLIVAKRYFNKVLEIIKQSKRNDSRKSYIPTLVEIAKIENIQGNLDKWHIHINDAFANISLYHTDENFVDASIVLIDEMLIDNWEILNKLELKKLVRLLDKSIELATNLNLFQDLLYLYKSKAMVLYNRKESDELIFEYFEKADSLSEEYTLEFNYNYLWLYAQLLIDMNEDYEKSSFIINQLFEDSFNDKDYEYSYFNIYWFGEILLYQTNYSDQYFSIYKGWYERLISLLEKDTELYLVLELNYLNNSFRYALRNKAETNYNNFIVPYLLIIKSSDKIADILKKTKPIGNDIVNLPDDIVRMGLLLWETLGYDKKYEEINMLLQEFEPFIINHLTNSWIDARMLENFYEFKSFTNLEHVNQYFERINSYEIDEYVIDGKNYYAKILRNYFDEKEESTKIFEDNIIELKKLDNPEKLVVALKELANILAIDYKDEEAKRVIYEALKIATSINNVEVMNYVYNMLFIRGLIDIDDKEYLRLSMDYLENSSSKEPIWAYIHANRNLLDYYDYYEEPDSALKYIMNMIDIKDQLEPIKYLIFLSDCSEFIWTDLTDKVRLPIQDCLQLNNCDNMSAELKIFSDEINYFINADISNFSLAEIGDNFFPVFDVMQQQLWMEENIIGSDYDQKIYDKIINYLLEGVTEFGEFYHKTVALNFINDKLHNILTKSINANAGYGFNFSINDDSLSVTVTNVVSTGASNAKLFKGDKILLDNIVPINRNKVWNYLSDNGKWEVGRKMTFNVVNANLDTIEVELVSGPNIYHPYIESPIGELYYFIAKAEANIDSIFKIAANDMHTNKWFIEEYKFLLRNKIKTIYLDPDNEPKTNADKIDLINRFESLTNASLIGEFVNHSQNLINNPFMMNTYNEISNRINDIQIKMQNVDIDDKSLKILQNKRKDAYKELESFEGILSENNLNKFNKTFDLNSNLSTLNQFDQILHYTSITPYDKEEIVLFEYITADSIAMSPWFVWGADTIDTAIDNINLQILKKISKADEELESLDALNKSLYNLTLNLYGEIPIIKKDTTLDVLIIPNSSLYKIPFELLMFQYENDSTNYHYWGEIYNVTYSPSLDYYIRINNKKIKSTKKALLVSANPHSNTATSYLNNLLAIRSEYGNIENVDNEIDAIDSIFSIGSIFNKKIKTTKYHSKSITEKKFKLENLNQYKYIHIAAHGVHDQINPDYSGILLGKEDGDEEDGFLQYHEIFPLKLNADLVVLSSCFSGFGEIDPNEGNLGIYRSFLIAGSKSVIISLWDVEDKSTSLLFSKFYENLKLGKTKAEALHLAKMYLKNMPQYSHPFYWAPFILIGGS